MRIEERARVSYVPLAAVAALACLVFVGSLVWGARRIDAAERRREEVLVGQEVDRQISVVAGRLNAFTLWDEAMLKLDGPVDAKWADNNIRSLTRNPYHQRVLLLDPDDQVVYAGQTSGAVPPSAAADLADLAKPAVARVRRVETGRPPPPINTPVRAFAIGLVEGRPAVAIAALVRSDTGKIKPQHARSPVLVLQASVDANLRKVFAERFLLADLQTTVTRERPSDDEAEVVLAHLRDDGRIVLRWTPQEPGATMLRRSAIFLAIAALGVALAGAAVVLHARRITRKLIASQAEARRLALEDPLTGLANRLLFADRLRQAHEQADRSGGALGLLCLDLDRFKDVNDTLGHEAGDELIREVGRRLKAICRAEDTVARLGGDEFAVLAHTPTVDGVAELAQRVVDVLAGSVQLSAAQVILSCSVGVTIVGTGVTQAEALRQADLALYRSKERGRGRYTFFEHEMDATLKGRRALEADLREAVEAEALAVAYQPLVDVRGIMCGLEALARWTHPVRGEVPPTIFIPVAETSGLISPMASHLFRRICSDARTWPGLPTSFNMSPAQFKRPGLVEALAAQLDEAGVEAAQFNVEITEGILLDDNMATQQVLADLLGLGFGLVLDDFGTGYSSLSYLDKYPIKKLKLDRSFVSRVTLSSSVRTIVTALLRMSEGLNLEVVAEGVETTEQFKLLKDIGCKEFQGFLFSTPQSVENVTKMMDTRIVADQLDEFRSGFRAPGYAFA